MLELLQSIDIQTNPLDVLYVIDDNSNDCSLQLVEQWKRNARVKCKIYANCQNMGYVKNFEYGVKIALKEESDAVIFFIDQDDIWSDIKVAETIKMFESGNKRLCFSDAQVVDKLGNNICNSLWKYLNVTKKVNELGAKELSVLDVIKNNVATGACMAIHSSFAKEVIPFCPYMPHDHWMLINSYLSDEFMINDKKLISYRIHDNNVIAKKKTWRKRICNFRSKAGYKRGKYLSALLSSFGIVETDSAMRYSRYLERQEILCKKMPPGFVRGMICSSKSFFEGENIADVTRWFLMGLLSKG